MIEIGKKRGNDFMAVRRLAQSLREQRIDIVQSHNWGTLLEVVIARRLAGTPLHIHAERGTVLGMVEGKGMRHWLRARAMSLGLAQVDKVMSNSHAVACRVQERCGFSAQRIEVIPNGVPELCLKDRQAVRQRVRSELRAGSDSVLVGSVGRLVEVKGFDVAVTAFAEVLYRQPNVHLVLVGDGPERDRLSRVASDLGIAPKVHLVGRHADVAPWLAAFDIYLNSSHSEGMSQSIIEAMAAGLPIVATDVGENSRLIGRPELQCGLLCASKDSNSLAGSLLDLLNDIPQREAFSRSAAQCHAKFYSESVFLGSVESLYQRAISDAKFDHLHN